MNDNHTLSVFTPSNTAPEDLEFILVQRHDLLQDAVERVRESALTDNKHHLLFVGPRGCGKTHLITLIVHRVGQDAELVDRLRIAWLNEDETCTTLLELLIKIHAALEKRYPDEYADEALLPAFEMKPDVALEFVTKHVLNSLGSRTLIVAAENLDAIFENLGSAGQKQLRAFIQENPRLAFVATAQKLVDSLSNRNSPFYGFFQTEHLKPLTVDEATELLKNISRLRGNEEVMNFLSSSRGRSRVQALHHLSGGNHRIYIVLSQFITRDSVDALVGPFMKMVDELTPYYQERVRWLPAQQRKIMEYLCACETTVPVKDIAKRLFASQQTISSQLKELREKGYVESNQRGRESLYEISEPLMRICIEVKENQRHQPLRLLVDFLRVWYDDQELSHKLGLLKSDAATRAYLESAIQRNKSEGDLRKRLLLIDLLEQFDKVVPKEDGESWLKNSMDRPEEFLQAIKYLLENDWNAAMSCLNEGIETNCNARIKAELFFYRAMFQLILDDSDAAIEDYSCMINLAGLPAELRATGLLFRGLQFLDHSQLHFAEADFVSILELPDAPTNRVTSAYVSLAIVCWREGRWHEGFSSLERGLERSMLESPPLYAPTTSLVESIFSAGLVPALLHEKVNELVSIYEKYQGLFVLGEGLVKNLGGIFKNGEPFPSSDKLVQWVSAWEGVARRIDEFRVPIRILRIGVDFLVAGGKDPTILLELTSAERQILKQALGLVEGK